MPEREYEITIAPDGTVELSIHGHKGKGCLPRRAHRIAHTARGQLWDIFPFDAGVVQGKVFDGTIASGSTTDRNAGDDNVRESDDVKDVLSRPYRPACENGGGDVGTLSAPEHENGRGLVEPVTKGDIGKLCPPGLCASCGCRAADAHAKRVDDNLIFVTGGDRFARDAFQFQESIKGCVSRYGGPQHACDKKRYEFFHGSIAGEH